jgi:hypothetical protein
LIGQPLLDRLARGNAFEVRLRERVLRVDPLACLRSVDLLEPAIRILDARAVIVVDLRDACGRRIRERGRSVGLTDRVGAAGGEQGQEQEREDLRHENLWRS